MLYVLLALVLLAILIVVLLNIKVNLRLHYDNKEDEVRCSLSYLFITYVILPESEERKRRKAEKKRKKEEKLRKKGIKPEKKEDKFSFSKLFKEEGIKGFVHEMLTIVKSLWNLIVGVLRRATLRNLEFRMSVAGEDAADTAVTYGYINAAVYPVVSALLENVDEYRNFETLITPDFSEDAESSVLIDVHLSIKPVKLIAALLENRSSAEKLLSSFTKNKKDKKD